MTPVWRRGIRATHKKILYFTKEYGEEDAFLPRKCKGDKFPRLTEKLKSGLHSTSYPGSFFGEGKTLVGAGHVTLTKLIA